MLVAMSAAMPEANGYSVSSRSTKQSDASCCLVWFGGGHGNDGEEEEEELPKRRQSQLKLW